MYYFFNTVKIHAGVSGLDKEMEYIKIMILFQVQELINMNKHYKKSKKLLQTEELLEKVLENTILKQIISVLGNIILL